MPDERIDRQRLVASDDYAETLSGPEYEGSASAVLVIDSDGSFPVDANAVFTCLVCEINGDETEGATPQFVTGNKVRAISIGTVRPTQGTRVVAHAVGGRWVFRWDG